MRSLGAGVLEHRVRIRRQLDVPNASFSVDETFPVEFDRWARVEQVAAATYYGSKQVDEAVTHWIVVRRATGTRPEDLTTEFVIEHKARRYRVVRSRVHPEDDQFTAIEALDLGVIPNGSP